MTPPSPDEVDRFISAIQDATRRRMLFALLRDDGPRTVDEMAALTGVHRTGAFDHLERLVDLGFLDKSQRRGYEASQRLSIGRGAARSP